MDETASVGVRFFENTLVNHPLTERIPRDYVRAYMLFNLAAANSSGKVGELAVSSRNALEKQMTREQIVEAQRLARE